MALALIAFDFDGVILESVDAKTQAFARIAEPFGEEARDRLVLYHKLHGGVSRVEKFIWLYREFVGRAPTDAEMADLSRRFTELSLDNVLHAPMVAGAQDVLERWKGRVPMVVCSGTPSAELRLVVEKRGFAPYFKALYGTPPAKSALLRQAVLDARADPADVVMIGDSSTDLDAAEDVGTRFYGRGDTFASTSWPWGADLTGLNDWLEQQC